ncbi:MAG: DNA methyltransferase [Varibaculum cambriense]|uniref:DNA methyltransferase n=1 Tax=Varibaculum cambriense TaxID=184870 RepID=UPI00291587B4|nr:DNA methyltransferase [Varibaculum cambriense]MDU4945001.1 DNA methyltransferase [Varibaculum cambriense]
MSGVGSRRRAAELFVQQWAGHGYEKGETHSFWLSLLQDVLGMREVSTKCRFEQRTRAGGFIDVVIPSARTIVEQKSSGVNLDRGELRQGKMVTPFEQAKRYADALPNRQRPDFIIVCNFECFRLHDLNKDDPAGDYIEFSLAELPEQSYLLDFLIDPAYSRTEKERKVSIRAGQLIGKLHRGLLEQYQDPDSAWSQHCLNVLCVRLVFCLFAEDAGLFGKDALLRYLRGFSASQTRGALQRLFQVLDTPLEQRDPYLEEELAVFPYVNGGLFRDSAAGTGVATGFDDGEDALAGASAGDGATVFPSSLAGETGRALEIPNFTEELCDLLLNEVSQGTDWSQISPTVFGGVFESTLNPETRRSGGMHYTSPENIHRVIDPLFLDDLKNELEGILSDPGISDRSRRAKLRAFQNRLASLTWLDSACGSGNFLTETYIEVRRLENQVIAELERGQQAWEFAQEGAATNQIKVNLGQFYGIEINDFAVAVARTALWIAELQANGETAAILQREVADLPLQDESNIVLANAIRMDWEQLLPAEKCSFLISNPPFIGYSNHSPEQKQDRADLFGKRGGGTGLCSLLVSEGCRLYARHPDSGGFRVYQQYLPRTAGYPALATAV